MKPAPAISSITARGNSTARGSTTKKLVMEKHQLPTGYRFYPTEEELISFYLHNKLHGIRLDVEQVIPVINIYDIEPWHLPKVSGKRCQGDTEQWFFFVPRQEREARGGRPTRTTELGYWKATGSPSYVYSMNNRVIGIKKTMVFYKGKAPTGRKTKWKMNEYRAIEEGETSNQSNPAIQQLRNEFSLCRIYVISGCFRAFDRRPLEAAPIETQQGQSVSFGRLSSPGDFPESRGSSSGEAATGQEQLPFDWELPDWLSIQEICLEPEIQNSLGN